MILPKRLSATRLAPPESREIEVQKSRQLLLLERSAPILHANYTIMLGFCR